MQGLQNKHSNNSKFYIWHQFPGAGSDVGATPGPGPGWRPPQDVAQVGQVRPPVHKTHVLQAGWGGEESHEAVE